MVEGGRGDMTLILVVVLLLLAIFWIGAVFVVAVLSQEREAGEHE